MRRGLSALLSFALLLGAAPPPPAPPGPPVEVEAVVPIADGDAAAARQAALERLFAQAVAVAAEAEAGVGVLGERPALARRLRRHARDYVVAYRLLADTYRLPGQPPPEAGAPASEAGAAQEGPEGPALPPPAAGGSGLTPAAAAEAAPGEGGGGAAAVTLPEGHYLVRMRAWIDRDRLRRTLGLRPRAAADLALAVRPVAAPAPDPALVAEVEGRLREALGAAGWRLGEEAAHRLTVEVARPPVDAAEGGLTLMVTLTGRLEDGHGEVVGLLQGEGGSALTNPDFARAEAVGEAVERLEARLRTLLPPPAPAAAAPWVTVVLTPLPSYGAGLELAELIGREVAGVEEVQRGTYAGHALRLRLRTRLDAQSLATALAALHWRDFTLHAEPRSATWVQVTVQRF